MKRTRIAPSLRETLALKTQEREKESKKLYSESKKSKGLGDTIEKFTRATGIKKVVDTVVEATGSKGCGCNARKNTLNKMFPYENSSLTKINK